MLLLRWSYSSQPQPFVQSDWLAPARVPLSLQSDVYGLVSSLLTPNPAQPFEQTDWPRPWDPRKATGEPLGTLNALLTPNPAQPFSLQDWPRPGDPKKAIGEAVGTLNALLTPNPAQPFAESDWPLSAGPQSRTIDASIAASLPLYFPGQPFSQDDWPLPLGYIYSETLRALGFGLNLNFPPPVPTPTGTVPLFTVSGPSVIDLFPTLVGVVYAEASGGFPHVVSRRTASGIGPANGYVTENGAIFYVAEDGTTFYVQEN